MAHPDLAIGREGFVATIRVGRPPHNFFDAGLIDGIADALDAVDADPDARVALLSAEGKNFCAGADLGSTDQASGATLYAAAARLFGRAKPLVAAVQGAAIGGGLGLALAADFRVVAPDARFQANFAALGLYPGFALTRSLAAVVGPQKARELLLTARSVSVAEAIELGLADRPATADALFETALAWAGEIAANAPLSLVAIRAATRTLDQATAAAAMTDELRHQHVLVATADFREAMCARTERRPPVFRAC